ncbi:MAG: PEF-CTERM sorting domain-containing protein [Methanophagales archaeon]|nr:PEF-CTERM sorting domain-containing protein [Methanophagales archaeon]
MPADGPQGYYEIEANGLETDYFTVEGAEIPEFSTIAIPVASILGLVYLFTRRGARKK